MEISKSETDGMNIVFFLKNRENVITIWANI